VHAARQSAIASSFHGVHVERTMGGGKADERKGGPEATVEREEGVLLTLSFIDDVNGVGVGGEKEMDRALQRRRKRRGSDGIGRKTGKVNRGNILEWWQWGRWPRKRMRSAKRIDGVGHMRHSGVG